MSTDEEERREAPGVTCTREACAQCGSTETAMRDYDPRWHEGDIYCAKCGVFMRHFDAG